MKRQFAGFLLCLVSFALPVPGAAAADISDCGWSDAIGLSMPERHAAIKAEAEARIGQLKAFGATSALRCQTGTMRAISDDDLPVWQDAQPTGDTHHRPGKPQGAARTACTTSAMLLQKLSAA